MAGQPARAPCLEVEQRDCRVELVEDSQGVAVGNGEDALDVPVVRPASDEHAARGACQAARRVVVTSATRMVNDLAGAEIHGQLERALHRYCRADFLVIDDFAVLAMDPAQANLAFQVITDRHDYRRSTCITTNRLFKDWPKVFPDALSAQVIAEPLTARAERFILDGKGYRLKHST